MQVAFHRNFKKQYKKLPQKIQDQFNRRLGLFMEDNTHPLLNVHPLRGNDVPLMSINITGDYRALFVQDGEVVVFHYIGTHGELYS